MANLCTVLGLLIIPSSIGSLCAAIQPDAKYRLLRLYMLQKILPENLQTFKEILPYNSSEPVIQ